MTFITGATMWLSGHESAIALHKHSLKNWHLLKLYLKQHHMHRYQLAALYPNTLELNYALEIPNMLSLLVGLDPSTVVKGLNEFPQETWPPFYTHTLFNLMVGTAAFTFAVAAIALLYWYFVYRKRNRATEVASLGSCRMWTSYDARH